MQRMFAGLAIVLWVLSITGIASASLVTNGSFELGDFKNHYGNGMSLPVGSTQIPGWTVINDETAWLNTPNFWGLSASDGAFFLDLTGFNNPSPYGGVSQTVMTAIGQQYTLSFDLGTDIPNPWVNGPVSVIANAGSTTQSFTLNPGSGWQTFNLDFVAQDAYTPISIIGTGGYQYIGLDSVSVNAVPIPSTILLFVSSLIGIAGISGIIKK